LKIEAAESAGIRAKTPGAAGKTVAAKLAKYEVCHGLFHGFS